MKLMEVLIENQMPDAVPDPNEEIHRDVIHKLDLLPSIEVKSLLSEIIIKFCTF